MTLSRRPSPTVRYRRLTSELRRRREAVNKSGSVVAKELGWQPSKITRIERGDQGLSQADLVKLLDLYEVTDQGARVALSQLLRDARERGWWADYRDVFGQGTLPDFEAEASVIRTFEAQVVPGLLQTPDYIKAIFRAGPVQPGHVVERHVKARLERQRILDGHNPTKLHAIVDEGALRRMVGGPGVMREQLQHLVNMAARHNIDIRVVPFSVGAHLALAGSFIILGFPDPLDSPVVFAESVTSNLFVEESHQLEHCHDVWGHLQGAALLPSESVGFIERLMQELT